MTDHLPSKDLCSQLRALPAGYRLLGYTAAEEIERLSRPAHEREPPHCSTCACGLAAEPANALLTRCLEAAEELFSLHVAERDKYVGYQSRWDRHNVQVIASGELVADLRAALTTAVDPLAAETRAATSRGAHSTEDAGRPRPSQPPAEPDWKHPKLQALLASEARLKIERDMIAALIDDPKAELYGLSDYETELTEKLRDRAAQPPGGGQ